MAMRRKPHALLLFIVLLGASSCRRAPTTDTRDASAAPASTARADELRESSRALLLRECGECHNGELDSALPGALRIYDLSELDWARHMTPEQLHDAEHRLEQDAGPVIGQAEIRPMNVAPQERQMFHEYVELVIAKR
jgi:hypothetical protein